MDPVFVRCPRRLAHSTCIAFGPMAARRSHSTAMARATAMRVSNRDGSAIVFTSGANLRDSRTWDLRLLQLDDGSSRQLTENDVRDASPVFSPDGRRILYVTTIGGARALASMDAAGGDREILFSGPGQRLGGQLQPRWPLHRRDSHSRWAGPAFHHGSARRGQRSSSRRQAALMLPGCQRLNEHAHGDASQPAQQQAQPVGQAVCRQ